jgi:hypothetical protein
MKLFYTGPVVNTEMLVVMLEKHGISARQEFADPSLPDDGDLNRLAKVFVPEEDYDRAHRCFTRSARTNCKPGQIDFDRRMLTSPKREACRRGV